MSSATKRTSDTGNETPKVKYILDDITRKIVDLLLDHPTTPYTKTQIAENADISRDALYRRWNALVGFNIIERAPDESGGDYWKLNIESDLVEAIATLLHQN